jgi:hypothetical protein
MNSAEIAIKFGADERWLADEQVVVLDVEVNPKVLAIASSRSRTR